MLLINPSFDRKQKLGIFDRYVPISVPIGLGFLVGYLHQQGRKHVKIFDEQIERLDVGRFDKLTKELDIDNVRFNNATPYPGTELYNIAKKENRLNPGKNWENLSTCGSLVEGPFTKTVFSYTPTTTEEELRQDILKANLYFLLRPSRIFRILYVRKGCGLVCPSRPMVS